jgi:glycosyltransferase involved in cell wall biosynthesis
MENPKISIITVVKNNKDDIENNIKSVLDQSYKNYEHIIIDGLSKDGTVNVLKKYHNNIHYWISENDAGLYDAMNKGIKVASGDIIGILNSDDIFYKDALLFVKKYFEKNKDIDFLFGTVNKYKKLSGYNPKKIFWSFGFYTSHSVGFFIKNKSQQKVGFYNTKYKYSADYDLFYRMIVKYKMLGMASSEDEVFGKFNSGGLSSRIRFIDYLKENTQIRLDNGQNKLIVYFIFVIRFLKNLSKILKDLIKKKNKINE